MGALGMAVILWVGGARTIEGRFDKAGMLAFFSYLVMLTWPMMTFGFVISMIQRGAAGVDRLAEVFAEREEAAGDSAGRIVGAIEAKGLGFAHGEARILDGISIRVPAGTTLGIVGPTGSGKSTLVSLLPRLRDPPKGALFVDGRDVHDIPLGELRAAIAFVPQEAFLFSTTIRENVAFARPDAPQPVLEAAARDACLERDLEGFPDGMETVVGERGVTLSGGQKQRVALARALVADAPILVLDDALSAVDAETEAAILESLRRVRAGRTVLVVAHRISAVRDADKILYLEGGRVAEEGTHAELLAKGGAYARLARTQEIEAEIEAIE
jgi:ATP-binding cassette subfamily B protein